MKQIKNPNQRWGVEMKNIKYISIFGMTLILVTPVFATMNVGEISTSIASNAEQVVEKAQEQLVDRAMNISSDITGSLKSKLKVKIPTLSSVSDSKNSVALVAAPLTGELAKETPSVADIQTWINKQTLRDETTPETMAATVVNQQNQLFVSAAKAYAIALDSQVKSVQGQQDAREAEKKVSDQNDLISMHKQIASMTAQMSQKLNAIGGLYAQLIELNSASALIGEGTGVQK